MNYVKQIVKCGCCGNSVEINKVKSRFRADYGLDNKPQYLREFPLISVCSDCGYTALNLEKELSQSYKTIVASEEYQKQVRSLSDNVNDKIELALKTEYDDEARAYLLLLGCWYLEFNNKKIEALAKRREAVSYMEDSFENEYELKAVIIYIDCLRQLKLFQDAMQAIQDLEDFLSENLDSEDIRYKLFMFEKKLIQLEDSTPHMVSEVML